MPNLTREQGITRTSIIGVIVNVLLSGFKALIGLISGSISIVLDAVNNLTDAVSSVVTIIGIRLARKKPDEKHPFGHGRIEYFSAIIVAGIVIAAGVTSLYESVQKIFHPELRGQRHHRRGRRPRQNHPGAVRHRAGEKVPVRGPGRLRVGRQL